jgi:hypothetical protein
MQKQYWKSELLQDLLNTEGPFDNLMNQMTDCKDILSLCNSFKNTQCEQNLKFWTCKLHAFLVINKIKPEIRCSTDYLSHDTPPIHLYEKEHNWNCILDFKIGDEGPHRKLLSTYVKKIISLLPQAGISIDNIQDYTYNTSPMNVKIGVKNLDSLKPDMSIDKLPVNLPWQRRTVQRHYEFHSGGWEGEEVYYYNLETYGFKNDYPHPIPSKWFYDHDGMKSAIQTMLIIIGSIESMHNIHETPLEVRRGLPLNSPANPDSRCCYEATIKV